MIVIFLLAGAFFVQHFYANKEPSFEGLLSLTITVFIVYIIKAIRLFFALYGSELGIRKYLETYCKVTLVNIILPYKLGEFFRMYCYGAEINNYSKGIIIICLDRFMDTAALCTMMLFWWSVQDGGILIFIMLSVLLFLTLLYFSFPSSYQFWCKYLLEAKASERKIQILKKLKALKKLYLEVQSIVKGRGFILYFLSLLAWIIEVGMQRHDISAYLFSVINGSSSQFVLVSVIELLLVYMLIKLNVRKVVRECECSHNL